MPACGRALPGVFKRSDPLAPCDKVADRYKHECFINHSGWLMTVAHDDVRKGTRYCLEVKGKFRIGLLAVDRPHGHESRLADRPCSRPRGEAARAHRR